MQPLTAAIIGIGFILLFVGALLVGGLWLARRYSRNAPNSGLTMRVGASDLVSPAIMALLVLAGTGMAMLYPTSGLGALLRTPLGILSALFAIFVVASALQVAFTLYIRGRAKRQRRS
jgi:hypothetical protein